METKKHPVDFAGLSAGSIIETADLEAALLIPLANELEAANTTDETLRVVERFNMGALRLADEITRRMATEGTPEQRNLKAVYRKRRIYILHAAEHLRFVERGTKQSVRRIFRLAAEAHRVDRTALTDNEQKRLDRQLAKSEFLTTALRKRARFQLPKPKD